MTAYDGLDDLLAGRRPPGVYRWHALVPPREARDEVERAGWRWAYVGGWTATDRPTWFRAVAGALDLPAYFGHNLDALVDSLRDLTGPTVLVWEHWARLARADQTAFHAILDVLRDRTDRPAPPPLAVLLWGAGPPTGTRSLD